MYASTPPADTLATTRQVWKRALQDPRFRDAPYKIETNQHGQLILSPHKPRHSLAQSRLLRLLDTHTTDDGEATVEFAVETPEGIKVSDVVWMSFARWDQLPEDAEASPVMPEICVGSERETLKCW